MDPKDTGRLNIRYRIAMPVEVRHGASWTSFTTEDVSFGGLFLRTAAPSSLRQLVRIRTTLPFSHGPFQSSAVVTRRIEPGDASGQVAGMGLAFFGLGGAEREQWDRFVVEAATRCSTLAETPFQALRSDVSTASVEAQADAPVLDVSVGSLEDLFVLHSRDASRAGIFLATDPDFSPGQKVTLHVTHAKSQSELWIPCLVKRVVRTRSRGIAVEFNHDSPEQLRAFKDFLARLIDEAEASNAELGEVPSSRG